MLFLTSELLKEAAKTKTQSTLRLISTARKTLEEIIEKELEGIREAGTWKNERIITSQQKAQIGINTQKEEVLNFCANNYLGLSVSLIKSNQIRLIN